MTSKSKKIEQLLKIAKHLLEETLDKIIEKYKEPEEIFLVDYRILGLGKEELFILEYLESKVPGSGKYVKTYSKKTKPQINGIEGPKLLDNGRIQFISVDDKELVRWTFTNNEERISVIPEYTGISLNKFYMPYFLCKDGRILVASKENIYLYSSENKLIKQGKWRYEYDPEYIYELSNNKILVVAEYANENSIYDMETLEYKGKIDIDGDTIHQINLDTFIVGGKHDRLIRYSPDQSNEYETLSILPGDTLTIVGNFRIYKDKDIKVGKLNLKRMIYEEIQSLPNKEYYSIGPYVFDDNSGNVYRLGIFYSHPKQSFGIKDSHKSQKFSKMETYKKGEGEELICPFPITRQDKLKATKHLDSLKISTDLLLLIVNYMVPEFIG